MTIELELNSIPLMPLNRLAEDARWQKLDLLEAYYRGQQDDGKRYDWDGRMAGAGGWAPVMPGWVVPYAMRKPSVRYDICKVIVRRLTSFALGAGRFPVITMAGDEDAEDFARELVKVSKMPTRMIEARNLGGACGSVGISWALRHGRPCITVHNAKHLTVLAWDDVDELRPRAVMKAWSYTRSVYDKTDQKMKRVKLWCARFWNDTVELRWRDVPDQIAREPNWFQIRQPVEVVEHNFDFCPFYWVQNVADSADYDGEPDCEGLEGDADELNRLLSATTKGTRANVDPTLVIKMDPPAGQGSVFKGSENAIYSRNGADYLELKGTAVQAAKDQSAEIRRLAFDTAGVVDADPEKISGSAQSAQALRILYAPMASRCDVLRTQYGEVIKAMLRDMLKVAREGGETLEDPETGQRIEEGLRLPPKFERQEPEGDDDEVKQVAVERNPGHSSEVELQWPPYFSPTWGDMKAGAEATKTATGGKAVLSQRTAISVVGDLFNIEDPDAELDQLRHEQEEAMERMQEAMGPPPGDPKKPSQSLLGGRIENEAKRDEKAQGKPGEG